MNEQYPVPHQDIPASQIYRAKDVRKSGMLRKKAGGRKIPYLQDLYDYRFIIIHKGWVYYYKNEKSEKQQGKFSLQGYSSNVVNAEEEEGKMQHVFKVYGRSSSYRTWYFAADNDMEKKEWMEAFRLEIEKYKFAASTIQSSVSSPVGAAERFPRRSARPNTINITEGASDQAMRNVMTNAASSLTVESGFCSASSLGPEDNYEPVNSGNPGNCGYETDEFDTSSEDEQDYLRPMAFMPSAHYGNSNPGLPGVKRPPLPARDLQFSDGPPIPKRDPINRQSVSITINSTTSNAVINRRQQRISSPPSIAEQSNILKPNSSRSNWDHVTNTSSHVKSVSSHHAESPWTQARNESALSKYSGHHPSSPHKIVERGPMSESLPKFGSRPKSSVEIAIPNRVKPFAAPSTKVQMPIPLASELERKLGLQNLQTVQKGNRLSADVTQISTSSHGGERDFNFIKNRPAEPLPQSPELSSPKPKLSPHHSPVLPNDFPMRDPPPPPAAEEGRSSDSHSLPKSPKRIFNSRHNLTHFPGSPPVHFQSPSPRSPNFISSYAQNSDMPPLHSNMPLFSDRRQAAPFAEGLEESEEYCDMTEANDSALSSRIVQPREQGHPKAPTSRHPLMPPMKHPADSRSNITHTQHGHEQRFSPPPTSNVHSESSSKKPSAISNNVGVRKPAVPPKPSNAKPGHQNKPMLAKKPNNVAMSHQPSGGVNAKRAIFEAR